ncbi:MAG: signal peptidase II [Bacilli bacterium]|nr:signal peptidase II [Bacilli bacterium]
MKKKITILSIISFLIIVIDRVVKIIVNRYIPLNKSISVIKNVFYLTNVHNEGAAFSIMTGLRYILIFLSVAFLMFIIYYMYKKKKYNIEFALIIGGLLGNLIDRVIFGYVIDYIGVIIFKYYFPIFNIADSLIVIGAIILLFRKDGDKNEVNSK